MKAKTEKKINGGILKITMTIAEMFPELSKYIGEMPVTISNSPNREMDYKTLKDYYDSLDAFLKNYSAHHGGMQHMKN